MYQIYSNLWKNFVILSGQFSNHFLDDLKKFAMSDKESF
jgi:hypothetical protein